jgi:hypothetical protein
MRGVEIILLYWGVEIPDFTSGYKEGIFDRSAIAVLIWRRNLYLDS